MSDANTPTSAVNGKVLGWIAAVIVVVGFLFFDHVSERGLLPNDMYCALGAGRSVSQTSYSSSPAICGASGCSHYLNSSTTTSYCHHGSIWDAITGTSPEMRALERLRVR